MRVLACCLVALSLSASAPGYVEAAGTLPACPTTCDDQNSQILMGSKPCTLVEPDSNLADATPDNACAMLTAYIQFGQPLSSYEQYFDVCSHDPDASTCRATVLIILHTTLPPTPCNPETVQQLAAHLHCGS